MECMIVIHFTGSLILMMNNNLLYLNKLNQHILRSRYHVIFYFCFHGPFSYSNSYSILLYVFLNLNVNSYTCFRVNVSIHINILKKKEKGLCFIRNILNTSNRPASYQTIFQRRPFLQQYAKECHNPNMCFQNDSISKELISHKLITLHNFKLKITPNTFCVSQQTAN